MEREVSFQLALPYELAIYDSVFYELRMEYVKSNDSKLSSMERQLEVLQTILKNQQNSQTAYESICAHARIMTETACSALLSLFPELKAKILVLLDDPSASTYTQIQNFGSFFHDKQMSDTYLFTNGKKLVQYLTMLRQIGNMSAHINTADVNVFDALTAISSSIQVATLLLGFSMKLNPFATQFSLPSSMEISYHQPSQHQLFQQPTLFHTTPMFSSSQSPRQQPIHAPTQPPQQPSHLSQPQPGPLSFAMPLSSLSSQPSISQPQHPPQIPSQPQPQQPPQIPSQPQQQFSYQQKLMQQPYLAVLTRPAPPQPASQPTVKDSPMTPHHNGHHLNGMHTTTTTTTTSTTNPHKYETSHLWVRNVDIAIDKNALASRFQAHVPKDLIQNIYINTPEIDNPCYYTAYINFKNVDAATRARNALDGVMLGSRKVSIQFNECPSLLKKGKMCISCKILSEQKGKVTWSKYWINSSTKK